MPPLAFEIMPGGRALVLEPTQSALASKLVLAKNLQGDSLSAKSACIQYLSVHV